MAFVGVSILLVTFSLFCYRVRPTSWSLLPWARSKDMVSQTELEYPSSSEKKTSNEDHQPSIAIGTEGLKDDSESEQKATILRQREDREAMPPPVFIPPVSMIQDDLGPSSSPETPKASAPNGGDLSSIPTFELSNSDECMPPPMFPAASSAQRASTGRDPPRLDLLTSPRQSSRSAGLMSPPKRSPLPDRTPPGRLPTKSSALAPPPTHSAIPSKPSKKVLLTPGHSPLDWAALQRNPHVNLSGLPSGTSYLRVPPSLLSVMNGRKDKSTGMKKDAWTCLSGKVYNISPYAPYHPGGEGELFRCAGKDGTKMFAEIHPWVNWEGMLEGCLVGIMVAESETHVQASPMEEMD